MRNLVVCCDGTWQTAEQEKDGVPTPSNVVRLRNALAAKDVQGQPQLHYYHPGVGTDGTWWRRTLGGSVGLGLSKNIMSAYAWLARQYQPGDRIYLFGFSRGAYTVRSLAGFIGTGLIDPKGLTDKQSWAAVEAVFTQRYRAGQPTATLAAGIKFHPVIKETGKVPIRMVGVWDTVGALGIPDDLSILNVFDDRKNYLFHDTSLGPQIEVARHALALDEFRASFTPTLWTKVAQGRDVKQVWFAGAHSDIGGGYPETGLSDIALKWMIEEAEKAGLAFEPEAVAQIKPDFRGTLHRSDTGVFSLLRTQPRSVPNVADDPSVHASAKERMAKPPISQAPYRPTRVLKKGEEAVFPVYAREPWNYSGIYLEKGKYRFTATGEWMDASIPCGPAGMNDGTFHAAEAAHLAGTLWGKIEDAFKGITNNHASDFKGTRRREDAPWFVLMGDVANAGEPCTDGTPAAHHSFAIGGKANLDLTGPKARPGYLYCYANDAWGFYDNNRGSVSVTIKRTA